MEETAYRRLKSAWFSNNTGSSQNEPFLAIIPIAFFIYFAGVFRPRFATISWDFLLLAVPITLNLTVFAYSLENLVWHATTAWLAVISFKGFSAPIPISAVLSLSKEVRPAWVTNFRACTYLVTIICILAVDLNIFPRKFAKTETHGFSLMDAGVGFFVICHGIVHRWKEWTAEIKDVGILAVLGILRTISVQSIDYQTQVSEYGVHWNFFWTLSICRFVAAVFSRFPLSNRLLFLLSGLVHSRLTFVWGDWVLSSASRDDFLSANREGIFSTPGYVTLYYAAAAFHDLITNYTLGKTIKRTFLISAILWTVSSGLEPLFVSRRLCNVGYILWILNMAFAMLLVLMIVDVTLKWAEKPRVPKLLQVINRKGFLFFMVGNILTGVINLKIQTLLLTTEQSYALLFVYEILVVWLTHIIQF